MDEWHFQPASDHGLPPGRRLASVRREPGLVEATAHWAWTGLAGAYLRVAHRLEVAGREHLPAEGPFVMAANHASHLDALALAASLPWRRRAEAFPVAAGDTFFQTPAASIFAAAALNALPMWRKQAGAHALSDLRRRLTGPECDPPERPDHPQEAPVCCLILFPEGTRSRDGQMRPFKAGMGMLVAGTAVPVVPCLLSGTFESLPPGRRWPRPGRVRLRIGPPLTFADVPNARDGWKHVAAEVEAAVRRLGKDDGAGQI